MRQCVCIVSQLIIFIIQSIQSERKQECKREFTGEEEMSHIHIVSEDLIDELLLFLNTRKRPCGVSQDHGHTHQCHHPSRHELPRIIKAIPHDSSQYCTCS